MISLAWLDMLVDSILVTREYTACTWATRPNDINSPEIHRANVGRYRATAIGEEVSSAGAARVVALRYRSLFASYRVSFFPSRCNEVAFYDSPPGVPCQSAARLARRN